ncbi:MAG: response regulator [Cyanobacteriota bacterium]
MSQSSKKILVIEDEREIRENLEELLSDKYEVIVSSGGREGLELAFKELPDVVICDVTMAGVTGHNVLTGLRSNPTTANTPFIFLTAKVSKDDVRLGMELGADDYLTKPYTRKELFSAIDARLKRLELQQSAGKLTH